MSRKTIQKNQSGYVGVTFDKITQKWKSTVSDNNVVYQCGFYDTPREAAKARDLKIIHFRLNKKLQVLTPKLK